MHHLLWRGLAAAVAGLALLALAATGQADAPVSAAKDASKPLIVKIHADWCSTCVRLGPTFKKLEQAVGQKARIVVLDVSDRPRTRAAYAEAKRLGVLEFFQANQTNTGTVGVLHGATRRPVKVLKGETDLAKYQAALEEARKGS